MELMGLFWATENTLYYTLGSQKPIRIITNHKPLVGTFSKPLSENTARILKLRLKLMKFNLEVTWEAGKKHMFADVLSQAPAFKEWSGFYPIPEGKFAQSISHNTHFINKIPCTTSTEAIVDDPSFAMLIEEAKKDRRYQEVASAVNLGTSKADVS